MPAATYDAGSGVLPAAKSSAGSSRFHRPRVSARLVSGRVRVARRASARQVSARRALDRACRPASRRVRLVLRVARRRVLRVVCRRVLRVARRRV